MSGWTVRNCESTDETFAPTRGRIDPSRLPHGDALQAEIGGDYWGRSFWPGNSGECFLDTSDRHVTLASPPFQLGGDTRHISFLIGGGGDGGAVWLELEGNPPGPKHAVFVDPGPGTLGMVRREHAVPVSLFGRTARLVVQGRGGHGILLDDVAASPAELPWKQPDGPVWGFADLHNHVFNHLTFGGRLIAGRVTEHPLSGDIAAGLRTENGMRHALEECEHHHGAAPGDQSLSVTAEFCHVREGFPTFDGWPKATTTMHEQVYVDWLRRAWQGGLRIVHVDAGNSAFAAQVFGEANFWLGGPKNPFKTCDVNAIERTLDAVDEFVAGEGDGWTEIARSSVDARRIVAEGKLAIVLGVEVDALGDYFTTCPQDNALFSRIQKRECRAFPSGDRDAARSAIHTTLEWLHERGIVHVIPIHVIENAFGTPATYGREFDINSQWANGKGYPLRNGWDDHIRYVLNDDNVDNNSFLTWILSYLDDVAPKFDPSRVQGGVPPDGRIGHTAAAGLTEAGTILLTEMKELGMLIDIQHMSDASTDKTLDWAEHEDYPLVLTHTGFRELSFGYYATRPWDPKRSAATVAEYDTAQIERIPSDALKSPDQIERLRKLGGMIGVGLTTTYVGASWGRSPVDFCDDTSITWSSAYRYAIEHTGGRGIGLGSDTNGLATLPSPRFGPDACLGAHGDDYRVPLLAAMASRQQNGVRYDPTFGVMGIGDAGKGRFADSGTGYAYSPAEREVWEGLAEAEVARAEPTVADAFHFIDSYEQRAPGRVPAEASHVRRYAKGFWIKEHGASPAEFDPCRDDCDDMDNCTQLCLGGDRFERAAYEAFPTPPRQGKVDPRLPFVKKVVDAWLRMQGGNRPMHKYVVRGLDGHGRPIDRDFDVNLEGMAHYGLLPDYLQDAKNVGLDEQSLASLFMGAEDYIELWERAERKATRPSAGAATARPSAFPPCER